MSNVMKELKAEISRLARREIHRKLAPLKRVGAAQRGRVAALGRQISALQKEVVALRKAASGAVVPAGLQAGADARKGFRITGKGVRALRKRLGLTQAGLGRLADVSAQTVVHWEATPGKISFRQKATGLRLKEIRAMKKRTLRKTLSPSAKK
jgi:DNA-binding transcriptional regulator YiaG